MWNIIVGVLFVIGGATGRFALIGTESPGALAVVGVVLIVWGGFQLKNRNSEA